MIDRIEIAADTTWSAGPVGATIDCDVGVEQIASDARTGSETDSLTCTLPIMLREYLDPPPLGRAATLYANGAELAAGTIVGIDCDPEGIRMRVDL
jgi:hypothetical protein